MKKIVIHLKEDKKRLETLSYQMGRFFLDYEIFDAIKASPGNIGISESFKQVIKNNITEKRILIFEDDVKFTSTKSIEYFYECIGSAPEDWDIILGGSYSFVEKSRIGNFIRVGDFSSLHCALVRDTAYEYFLNHNPEEIKDIDRHLGRFARDGKLNVYICNPMIAIQYNGFSHNREQNVNYDNLLKGFTLLT
jgi:GR25 family glycosyltransferase involved in LPS biosynthesis